MAIDRIAIGVAAGNEVRAIFRDGLEALGQGEAQYLVDGAPESISGRISQAAGRSACRTYGSGSVDLNPRAAERYERVCRPYLNTLAPGNGPSLVVPFDSGQCDGEIYLVTWTYESGPTEDPTTNTVFSKVFGPLAGASEGQNSSGSAGAGLTSRGGLNRTSSAYACGGAFPVTIGPLQYRQFVNAGRSPAISGVSPCGPDLCGNPPPVIGPPTPIPDPNPPPFRFNPGPTISVDIDVDLAVDGSLTVNIGTGPITIDPFSDNPFDDGGGAGSGGGTTEPPPGDIGDAGGASNTGDGGETEGEAGQGKVLVGLRLDVLASPLRANQYAPGVFRGAAYIYMGVEGNLDQDYGGSMLKDGQFFFAERSNLTHWSVSANNGYSFRVTPYYREVTN